MHVPNRVLIVDDEERLRRVLARLLADEGYEAAQVGSGEQALELISSFRPDVVVMDQNLPGMSGQEATTAILEQMPGVRVIVITAFGAIERAVDAMRRGAHDYLTKPFDNDEFLLRVQRAMEARRLARRVESLQDELGERYSFGRILGESENLRESIRMAQRAAQLDVPVLVEGESGTGKELLVRAIHQASGRRDGPFVAVNCAAIPADLVESEFFGHEKGAFTGAGSAHTGRFAQAHGGTLFLDEIGEMPAGLQAKLLRALEDGEITPVGGNAAVRVDARVVAATNREATEAVRQGALREDLYHRLAVLSIRIPPLRERPGDIGLLARHFLAVSHQENGTRATEFSPEAMVCLDGYGWPGNVRELRNAVQSAAIMADGEVVRHGDLPPGVRGGAGKAAGGVPEGTLGEAVGAVEKEMIVRVLAEEGGNKTRAAERLGITRKTLAAKMGQHGLE